MAWNPSPKVGAARDIGKKFNADKVIIILINEDVGTIESISYGKTPEECKTAKTISDIAYNAVYNFFSKTS